MQRAACSVFNFGRHPCHDTKDTAFGRLRLDLWSSFSRDLPGTEEDRCGLCLHIPGLFRLSCEYVGHHWEGVFPRWVGDCRSSQEMSKGWVGIAKSEVAASTNTAGEHSE